MKKIITFLPLLLCVISNIYSQVDTGVNKIIVIDYTQTKDTDSDSIDFSKPITIQIKNIDIDKMPTAITINDQNPPIVKNIDATTIKSYNSDFF